MKSDALSNFWKGFKHNLKIRLAVCIALVLSVTLFNSLNYPWIRFASSLATLVLAELLVYFYVPFYLDNLKLLFKNKAVEMPLPKEITELSMRMGLKIKKMKVFPSVCNAYARGNQLYVGQRLLEKLDSEQITAVIAHEFGHIKGRHATVQIFYILPIMLFVGLSWSQLPPAMSQVGLFAYMMIALVPIHWSFERRADMSAIKYVGKAPLKSALLMLINKEELSESSETHPSANNRLKWIEEAKI